MTVVLYICCVLCLCIVPATWVVFQYAVRYACAYDTQPKNLYLVTDLK